MDNQDHQVTTGQIESRAYKRNERAVERATQPTQPRFTRDRIYAVLDSCYRHEDTSVLLLPALDDGLRRGPLRVPREAHE